MSPALRARYHRMSGPKRLPFRTAGRRAPCVIGSGDSASVAIVTSDTGQDLHGLEPAGRVIHNPSTSQLYTAAIKRGDGRLAEGGPLAVDTGRFTGRSPQDKFVVDEPGSRDRIWWGDVNHPLDEDRFDGLRAKVVAYLNEQETLYVVDALRRCRSRAPHRRPSRHREPVPRAVREDDVHRPDRAASSIEHEVRRAGATRARRRGERPRPTARGPARSSCCTRPARRS